MANRVKDYHWVNCGGCGRFVSWINPDECKKCEDWGV